jgi:hypothetical protein
MEVKEKGVPMLGMVETCMVGVGRQMWRAVQCSMELVIQVFDYPTELLCSSFNITKMRKSLRCDA